MEYFDFLQEYKGIEFRSNGRVICKAAAWCLLRLGRWDKNGYKVTMQPKPGWENGDLKSSKDYDKYFETLNF